MPEVLEKNRQLPQSVLLAKASGDTAMLSALGKLGNATKRVLNLRRKKHEPKVVKPPKKARGGPYTEAQLKKLDITLAYKKFVLRQKSKALLNGAKDHAAANRVGWDDNYDPMVHDPDIVWFK